MAAQGSDGGLWSPAPGLSSGFHTPGQDGAGLGEPGAGWGGGPCTPASRDPPGPPAHPRLLLPTFCPASFLSLALSTVGVGLLVASPGLLGVAWEPPVVSPVLLSSALLPTALSPSPAS